MTTSTTIETINLGSGIGAGDGDGIRDAFSKINNNFQLLQSPIKVFSGLFTPSSTQEYPTNSPFSTQTWLITGVDETNGYTFFTKNLVGQTIYNGNELYYDGVNWAILKTNNGPFLLSDGSVKMDNFYTPSEPKDIVTVDYLSSIESQISLFDETILLLNTAISEKADSIHTHVKDDIIDADWISCLCEDLNPQLGGNLDLNNKRIFNTFDSENENGEYGLNFQNISGGSEIYLTSSSIGDLFSFSLSQLGNSAIISTKDMLLNSSQNLNLFAADGFNVSSEVSGSTNIILKTRKNSGTGDIEINDIKMPAGVYSRKGQIMISDLSDQDNLVWEDLYKFGSTASRPIDPPIGTMYLDTDLNKPIWMLDNTPQANVWIDAVGAPV